MSGPTHVRIIVILGAVLAIAFVLILVTDAASGA